MSVPDGNISVVAPVSQAVATVKHLLFRPFDISKWFIIGFTAWLAALSGENAFSIFNFSYNPFPGNPSGTGQELNNLMTWLRENIFIVVTLASLLGLILIFLTLILGWVGSRGKFIFLDNVTGNKAEVRSPWQRRKIQGNSYFLFAIGLGLAALLVIAVMIAGVLLIAAPDLTRRVFGAYAVTALAVGGILFMIYGLILACIMVFLDDFVVPIMSARSCRILEAWAHFGALLKLRPGMFLLYLLFRMVLQTAVGIAGLLLCCITCCVAMLPYIGTVILLPLHVFMRAYSLHFLEQFGEPYRLINYVTTEPYT